MDAKTDIVALYLELCEKIKQIQTIEWIDLWNNQVTNLDLEHPFPAPAVFLAFRANTMQDLGEKMQEVNVMVDVFLFYETFADTYDGAFNQEDALKYLQLQSEIQRVLHGSRGEHYSSMRRIGFSPVDTGDAGNLYVINFQCKMIDKAAQTEFEKGTFADVQTQPFVIP